MDSDQISKNRNKGTTVLLNTVGLSSVMKFTPKYYLPKDDILNLCQPSISE